jgi:hypothetical protein
MKRTATAHLLLSLMSATVLAAQPRPIVEPSEISAVVAKALSIASNDKHVMSGVSENAAVPTDPSIGVHQMLLASRQTRAGNAPAVALSARLKRVDWRDYFSCPPSTKETPDGRCTMKQAGHFMGVFGVESTDDRNLSVLVSRISKHGNRETDVSSVTLRVIFEKQPDGTWKFVRTGEYQVS